jgi:CHAD domain-containing protein
MEVRSLRRYREHEITFKVKQSWRMPDLSTLQPEGGALDASTDELQATYFDTPQATLQRLGITLRRRTGGADAGWHLKLTDGPARTEFQSRSRGARLPDALSRRLAGVLAGQELTEVATIATTRQASRLRDQNSAVVVEVADDQVSGATLGEAAKLDRWREVEVELGPAGDEEVLAKITKIFRRADARPAKLQRKLDRLVALNGSAPVGNKLSRAVAAYAHEQVVAILRGDIALRDKPGPEAVHQTRVAIRRLRSTLRNFGPVFALEPEAAADLDETLRWLAGLLSPIRDGDILARRLTAELAELPAERVLGPVAREIAEAVGADRAAAIKAWQAAWRDERYLMIMTTLREWLVGVPVRSCELTGEAVLRKARRKASRRLDGAADDPDELHRARKATKRLRYAGELLTDLVPQADRTAKKAKNMQTVLGDHQDLVVAAHFLQRAGAQNGVRPGHNGYTYGLLTARVEEQAARIRAGL